MGSHCTFVSATSQYRPLVRCIAVLVTWLSVAVPPASSQQPEHKSGDSDRVQRDAHRTDAGAHPQGITVTLAAVGDLLLHGRLQRFAYGQETGFRALMTQMAPFLSSADVTYGNLEGPTARGVRRGGRAVTDPGVRFDDVVYTSYPTFNSHPRLISDLNALGFDVLSTANNHALDRRSLGVDRTLDALAEEGIAVTGTRRRGRDDETWHTVVNVRGVRIAFLSCAHHTNQIPDRYEQVLFCFQRPRQVTDLVTEIAARDDVDVVVVTPHWGRESELRPSPRQRRYARRWIEAGAMVVLGSHPHVLQPWERYVSSDGREGFIAYSLGNFISGMEGRGNRHAIVLTLELRVSRVGTVSVGRARFTPAWMRLSRGNFGLERLGPTGPMKRHFKAITALYGEENLLSSPLVAAHPF